MAAPQLGLSWNLIPEDIALKIASFLEGADVCSLGSCSRFWYRLCVSDCLWMELSNRRWPTVDLGSTFSESSQIPELPCRFDEVAAHEASSESRNPLPSVQGWKDAYIYKHQSLACTVSTLKEFLEECTQNTSLEAGYYLKAVSDLRSCRLGFKDVQILLLAKSCSVFINLVGLHYCLFNLQIAPVEVVEALHKCQVAEREIYVSWLRLGRWFYGFRLHDEHHSRRVSLGDLAMDKYDEILGVLDRAFHEVVRVYISQVIPESAASNSLDGGEN